MKLIKTRPKFKCDFCNYKAGIVGMTKHEKICWKNPNRYCETCENTGELRQDYGEGLSETIPCFYCSKYDKEKDIKTEDTDTNPT